MSSEGNPRACNTTLIQTYGCTRRISPRKTPSPVETQSIELTLINRTSPYQLSEERKRKLQLALTNFRGAVEKYQTKHPKRKSIIIAKPLEEYNLEDVLSAIKSIETSQEVQEYPRGLKALGKGFEHTMKSRGMLRLLLDFVPKDSYCAPICGSFSFMLGVSP